MKIDQITLYNLSMPLLKPFETSFGRAYNRDCIVVEVLADGLAGWGECTADREPGYSYETTETVWHILKDFLAPALISSRIIEIDKYRSLSTAVRGHHLAKAGLEMALWDLRGKAEKQPLVRLLGGQKDRVAVGVSVGLQESPKSLVITVQSYLNSGYGRVKIKIKPGRDIEDTRAVRRAFSDLPLQVDANSAYDLKTAEVLLPLDDLDLLLIEQPLSEDDLWDHRKLQGQFSTPLCLDESITSARHARQALGDRRLPDHQHQGWEAGRT
jgi:o-succinylbenzoate synthase